MANPMRDINMHQSGCTTKVWSGRDTDAEPLNGTLNIQVEFLILLKMIMMMGQMVTGMMINFFVVGHYYVDHKIKNAVYRAKPKF